ncbi:PAS domain S-box protein [Saccharopolyspora griseoalba]|uniref:PAS domain S-box protein n=1 Tax=Saccharopolyspora griseoalba TaxID=1431848 RepID=A0ABW2LFF0_9PSEU
MTENAPATSAIVVADPAGTIIGFDAGAEEFFGHPATEAMGKTLDVIVPADLQDAHWKGFYGALDANHADLEGNPVHLPVHCRDGQVRVFPGVFRLLRDPRGNAVGAVATYSPAVEAEPFTPVPPG